VVESGSRRAEIEARHVMAPPYVVKPNNEGSSVGVYIVHEAANGPPRLIDPRCPDPDGRGLCAGARTDHHGAGRPALTVTDILTDGWYDYDAKYKPGGSRHVVPAEVPEEIFDACLDYALRAHARWAAAGISRTDFRWDEARGLDGLVLLETNTQPGMTPTSLTPEQAAHTGHRLRRALPLDGGGRVMRPLAPACAAIPRPRARPTGCSGWMADAGVPRAGAHRPAGRAGAGLALGAYLTDEGTRRRSTSASPTCAGGRAERPEFMVNLMAIDGASAGLAEDIREPSCPRLPGQLLRSRPRGTCATRSRGSTPVARRAVRMPPGRHPRGRRSSASGGRSRSGAAATG
jgi:hypothetical protein